MFYLKALLWTVNFTVTANLFKRWLRGLSGPKIILFCLILFAMILWPWMIMWSVTRN